MTQTAPAPRRALHPVARLTESVCRRAFSSPEAWLYEATIARALADTLAPALLDACAGRVLDVGAGGGTLAARIARERDIEVVAIDPSVAQVRRAARLARRTPGLSVRRAGVEEIPFADGSFDTVVSTCAWKHWRDPHAGVAECRRVLAPGGALVIVEVDGTATPDEFWAFARTSRVPWGMKRAYLRFAMRTVVGVAPGPDALGASFADTPVTVARIPGLPFLLARATR